MHLTTMNGFLNPEQILKQLKLKPSMTAADFGCGSGGWVLPLAKMLEDGRVYGIDILEEPLSALRSKAKMEKLYNIISMKADVEKGTTLLSKSCDLVLMTNLLFQAENKKGILKEAKRVLKPKGRILVVDWKSSSSSSFGPVEGLVSLKEVKKMAEETGLKASKEFEASLNHWGLVLEELVDN